MFQGEQCLSLSRMQAEHSVTWVTGAQINGRDGTVLRRGSSAVDKYNELPALHLITRPRSAREHRCRDGQRTGSGVRAAAIPLQLPYGDTGGRYPQEFRSAQPFTCCQPSWTILASMGTRPDTPVRALRRRHDALLTIWLAFLDELDNPVHPLAAECQQEPRLRRDTSTRGLSQIRAVNCSLLVRSAKRPRLVGPRGSLKRGVATV